MLLLFLLPAVFALKYPNEIVDTPVVLCEPERIVIKIRTTSSNPSHIYAEDHGEDVDCSSRNMNKVAIRHGKCGMNTEKTENPSGVIQRVCISVQLHPLFVTEADRTYCAQCVYVESHVLDELEQTLDISEAPPTELSPQFDFNETPKCSYTIRKGSETGPEVRYATIGESVFHVWQCQSENSGILVQNCHVEDGQGNRILIIDQNGCGVDHYVMATPDYSDDLTTAFQETHVFKFAQKTITRFICQIRICLKGDDCKKVAPPSACPTLEERLAQAKKLRDAPRNITKQIHKTTKSSRSRETLSNAIISATQVSRSEEDIEDESILALTLASDDVMPPGTEPLEPVPKNSTLGSIYFGYGFDGSRPRRNVLVDEDQSSRKARFSPAKGYAEVDLVGELRVLDSEQDVQYYEKRTIANDDCMSQLSYGILLTALSITGILLIVLCMVLIAKSGSIKNKIVRFAH